LKSETSLKNKFKESKEYIGKPAIFVFANNHRMDLNAFGEKRIVKETTIDKRNIDLSNVYYLKATLSMDIFEDEVDLYNIGVPSEDEVYMFALDTIQPSIMNDYPDNYKFIGVELEASSSRKIV